MIFSWLFYEKYISLQHILFMKTQIVLKEIKLGDHQTAILKRLDVNGEVSQKNSTVCKPHFLSVLKNTQRGLEGRWRFNWFLNLIDGFPSLKARPGKNNIGQNRGRAFLRWINHVRYRCLYLRLAGDERGFPHLSIPLQWIKELSFRSLRWTPWYLFQ